MPPDCKQDDFSSGTLKSQVIFSRPDLEPSTNLEMTHIFHTLPDPAFLLWRWAAREKEGRKLFGPLKILDEKKIFKYFETSSRLLAS